MKKILAIVMAALGFVACTNNKNNESETAQPKVLVLYYSQTGATKTVAEELQKQLNADIEAIEMEQPYEGDFEQTVTRCRQEMESGEAPAVKALKSNIADYDIIFLGYPVWCGIYAQPIAGLLKNETFEGKKVVTFCTFGSGGLQTSTEALREALPNAEVVEGYGVRNARIAAVVEELNRFLIEWGYKEGEVEALPAFMEHHPVSAEEVEVFDQACGNYQFPLGTPVDVAVRETAASTDYEYSVKSVNQNGEETMATIYVTSKEGVAPEFTQVVR